MSRDAWIRLYVVKIEILIVDYRLNNSIHYVNYL